MQALVPAYLPEIARQIGFTSAFLGGVSATFLFAVLALPERGRIPGRAIVCAAAASVAFVVAVMATTMLAVTLDPEAPAGAAGHEDRGRVLAFLSFMVGIYLLLGFVGLSGLLRSRRAGRAMAGLGALPVTLTISA